MALFKRLFILIPSFLIGVPAVAQSATILPFSLSVTQSYEHPAELYSTRAVLTSKLLRSAIALDDTALKTWNVRFRFLQRFQILGGSISVSELAARAKNPAPALVSPVFRPVTAASGWILGPGSTQMTKMLAAEAKGRYWHLAACGSPEDPVTPGSWTYGALEIPERLPFRTSARLALFGGITSREEKKDTAWFDANPRIPAAPVLFPGAELAITNRFLTCSASGFRSIPRLARDTGALRADAAITLGVLTLAGGFFRSDDGFCDFDGSRIRIRERLLAAPSVLFRLPGTRKTVSRLRFLYARDILSPDKMDRPLSARDWYGSRISVENPLLLLQGTAVYTDDRISFSGRGTLYRVFVPWLRTDLEGKAQIPSNQFSRYSWLNQCYRFSVTMNADGKMSRFKISTSAEAAQQDRYSPIVYRFGGLLSATLFSTHTSGKLTIEGQYATEKPRMEAKISFSALLR